MSLVDAIIATGQLPPDAASRAKKQNYSQRLSSHLAVEVAEGLRAVGFPNVRPARRGPSEKAFQGGLGPKRVDVSYSDERHGLLLAVSIKSINFAPFGKNLKNRFADLCTEAITLHLRFPYSVIAALFVMPASSDMDITKGRLISTFQRASKLLATISGRKDYTDPGEKFENVTMLQFQPVTKGGPEPACKLFSAETLKEISEEEYFLTLRRLYNNRNPHALIGEERIGDDE